MVNSRKIKNISQIVEISQEIKKMGKKIVLCHGVFDILHMGHISLLNTTKKSGDVLVVGVECDSNVKFFKGKDRPINNEYLRSEFLSNISCVDYVFLIPKINKKEISKFYTDLYKRIEPWAVGSSSRSEHYIEQKNQIEMLGINFVGVPIDIKISSSKIIDKLGLD